MARPREYDRKEVADNLLKWAQKEDSINLCGFCAEYLVPAGTMLRWKDEDDWFRETYEMVRCMIGSRRESLLTNGKLHVKAFDLNAKTYDPFLRDEHRNQVKYDAMIKAEANIRENKESCSNLEYWRIKQENKEGKSDE